MAAVLSGGIFGDHASPISDTTIVSSLVAGIEHIDHVRTQLPCALIAGAISAVGFVVLGLTIL
ncbi:Na+/H+ antiporter NhaC family protein [Microbulbifer celer]|nr:Na+/H+ antiporter NhaC family protein [Microbulbifer celer]UFN59120.1 Na+/H+ antiporter NhaC family protein [Microbulbifer celer]